MDDRIRRAERRAAQGDPQASEELIRLRERIEPSCPGCGKGWPYKEILPACPCAEPDGLRLEFVSRPKQEDKTEDDFLDLGVVVPSDASALLKALESLGWAVVYADEEADVSHLEQSVNLTPPELDALGDRLNGRPPRRKIVPIQPARRSTPTPSAFVILKYDPAAGRFLPLEDDAA